MNGVVAFLDFLLSIAIWAVLFAISPILLIIVLIVKCACELAVMIEERGKN